MKYFFGLGNPGSKYHQTRHNVGQMFLDFLAQDLSARNWQAQKKLRAELIKSKNYLLAKNTTFMNESGWAVRSVLDYYANFPIQLLQNFYLAHDDLDLELGQFKLQFGTGPRQHNGLTSVYEHLGTDRFWHVRIGIDERQGDRSIPAKNYVLQKLGPDQIKQLDSVFKQIVNKLGFFS